MKKTHSLKSLKKRKGCIIVKRGKRTRLINKEKPKFKACQ